MKKSSKQKQKSIKQILLKELLNQQNQFRCFINSLDKKNKNAQRNSKALNKSFNNKIQNPQNQSFQPYLKSIQKQSKFIKLNRSLKSSRKQLLNAIKKQQDFPAINLSNNPQIMYSTRKSNIKQMRESLSILNKKNSKQKVISTKDQSIARYKNNPLNIKQRQSKRKTPQSKQKKQKFRLSKLSNITWNPHSRQLIDVKQQSGLEDKQKNCFLLQILKISDEKAIQFFNQNKMQNLKQLSGNQICLLFQLILSTLDLRPLESPLIKKYNNCLYYGQMPNFQLHHTGIILYNNGNSYFGSMKNFQKQGLGIQFVKQKNVHNQQAYRQKISVKKADKVQKQDSYIISKGNFHKNSKTGQFLIKAQNYVYQGSLIKGSFQGYGVLVSENSTFKGIWQMNKKKSGIQNFLTQNITYEGLYQNQKFHGKGKLKTPKQFYQGQFKNGLKHGKGIIVDQNSIFEGNFSEDKKNGKGILLDKNIQQKSNNQQQSFKKTFCNNMFKVLFKNDELIQKKPFQQKQYLTLTVDSLQEFQDKSSFKQSINLDVSNNQPSRILQSHGKQQIPSKTSIFNKLKVKNKQKQKQKIIERKQRINESKFQNIHFNIIPAQPQQQYIYGSSRQNFKISHLEGNSRYRSNRKWNMNI